MKTKSLILIAFVAIITLSFSFASFKSFTKNELQKSYSYNQNTNDPIGGFYL